MISLYVWTCDDEYRNWLCDKWQLRSSAIITGLYDSYHIQSTGITNIALSIYPVEDILDVYKISNLRIANGRMGKYVRNSFETCVKSRAPITVDYVLCTPFILNILRGFKLFPNSEFSDHKPTVFNLNLNFSIRTVWWYREAEKRFGIRKVSWHFYFMIAREILLNEISNVTQDVQTNHKSVS